MEGREPLDELMPPHGSGRSPPDVLNIAPVLPPPDLPIILPLDAKYLPRMEMHVAEAPLRDPNEEGGDSDTHTATVMAPPPADWQPFPDPEPLVIDFHESVLPRYDLPNKGAGGGYIDIVPSLPPGHELLNAVVAASQKMLKGYIPPPEIDDRWLCEKIAREAGPGKGRKLLETGLWGPVLYDEHDRPIPDFAEWKEWKEDEKEDQKDAIIKSPAAELGEVETHTDTPTLTIFRLSG